MIFGMIPPGHRHYGRRRTACANGPCDDRRAHQFHHPDAGRDAGDPVLSTASRFIRPCPSKALDDHEHEQGGMFTRAANRPALAHRDSPEPDRPCPCPGPNSTRPCRPHRSRSPSSGPAGWRSEAGRVRFRAAAGQRCTVVRRRPLPGHAVPADAAASIRAMSIFRIVIIASIARLALARSGSVVSSISRFGVICQE